MSIEIPKTLGLIAGRGSYPRLLAQGARRSGVGRIVVIAFRGETERAIAGLADHIEWLHVGQVDGLLKALRDNGITRAVMAGQIAPSNLFRLRLDARAWAILKRLKARNARTIFGAIVDELRVAGVELLPAYRFMEDSLPAAGLLGRRAPTGRERLDMELGLRAAKAVTAMEIGQTVVVKDGVILAVEAFEGTDAALRRAGRLGGPGAVVVKAARADHDMRYDIPIVGLRTMAILKSIRAAALAVEARRTLLLEPARLAVEADRQKLAFMAITAGPVKGNSVADGSGDNL